MHDGSRSIIDGQQRRLRASADSILDCVLRHLQQCTMGMWHDDCPFRPFSSTARRFVPYSLSFLHSVGLVLLSSKLHELRCFGFTDSFVPTVSSTQLQPSFGSCVPHLFLLGFSSRLGPPVIHLRCPSSMVTQIFKKVSSHRRPLPAVMCNLSNLCRPSRPHIRIPYSLGHSHR